MIANVATAVLELTGTAASIGGLSGGGATGGNVVLNDATLTANVTGDTTYAGVISGAGGFVKNGAGVTRLTGFSSYTGSTVVNAGVLVLQGADNRLSSSTVVYLNGGQTDLNDKVQTWAGLSGSAGANIYSYRATAGSLVLNVASGTSYTYAGTLGTTYFGYSVVKNGDGTQVFTGANVYNQGTSLNSGTLSFANNSLGTTGTVTLNGGTLRWQAGNTQDISARLALVSGSTATLDTGGNNVTFATSFGDTTSAELVKQGAGTLTLSASTLYTGTTIISAGALKLGSGASLASTMIKAGVVPGSGATFDVSSLPAGLELRSGQTLGGHGTILGNVVVGTEAVIAPGGSIGTLTQSGTLTWAGGGTYQFQVFNAGGAAGTGYDMLTVSELSITARDKLPFIISIDSLTNADDQIAGALLPGSWNPDASYQWKLFVATNTTFDEGAFSPTWFALNTSSFASLNDSPGAFSIARGGVGGLGGLTQADELYIVYPVVEPGTPALVGPCLGLAAWGLRRGRGSTE